MRSSFSRKAPAAAETGTRPGLHGQTLLSMGLVDLDRLLGGGLPLGSLLLVLEDAHSQQHLNLMKYFMAEGVMTGQKVAWLCTSSPRGGPSQFLPAEASTSDPSQGTAQQEDDEESQAELKIAWQYRKYIQQQQRQPAQQPPSSSSAKSARGQPKDAVEAGISRQWCRNYDLTKPMGQDKIDKAGLVCLEGLGDSCASGPDQVLKQAHEFVQNVQAASTGPVLRGPEGVGRLIVQSLGSPCWWAPDADQAAGAASGAGINEQPSQHERHLVCQLQRLRQLLQDTRSAALVTCPAGLLHPSTVMRLQHAADAVLCLQTISDDSQVFALLPQSTSACALLAVNKLPSAGMLAPRLPDGTVYVVRNKRRRLAITPVDVDPDAEARQQQQQAAAALAAGDSKAGARQVDKRPGQLDF